jgi:predicted cytidylate kinase
MVMQRSITLSGDLGSGKSTVATELSRRLGLRKVSMGDYHRELARSEGLSSLQMNRPSARAGEVDTQVDGLQRELARSGEPLIVDSRLGWHFFADAFKVQLQADPMTAARRVLSRPSSATEGYVSLEDALRGLRERSETERARFLQKYGVDKSRLHNYDLVCDTTSATPDEVADLIVRLYLDESTDHAPALALDPDRVGLGGNGEAPEATVAPSGQHSIWVDWTGSSFVAMGGHDLLRAAKERGDSLVCARLLPERETPDDLPG